LFFFFFFKFFFLIFFFYIFLKKGYLNFDSGNWFNTKSFILGFLISLFGCVIILVILGAILIANKIHKPQDQISNPNFSNYQVLKN
jgi:hypothetical protein